MTRIHQEMDDLDRVVSRAERAVQAARQQTQDQDLYIDSAALNLHDFYAGLERIFQQVGSTVDGNIPAGHNWHRELLQQMQTDLPDLRPPVLSSEVASVLDEFLRFRHVLRNVYAFQFDPERIARLVEQLTTTWVQVKEELTFFTTFLKQVGQ
ncbi:MAG: hypothetical protein WAS33_14705 [Candidatus Promineifilaceae bacterium]